MEWDGMGWMGWVCERLPIVGQGLGKIKRLPIYLSRCVRDNTNNNNNNTMEKEDKKGVVVATAARGSGLGVCEEILP
jgi:hypothetical protein